MTSSRCWWQAGPYEPDSCHNGNAGMQINLCADMLLVVANISWQQCWQQHMDAFIGWQHC
jgi:hypothetical protein